MAFPTWSKAGVTTVTFSSGRFFPYPEQPQEPNQIVGESDDKTVVVASLGSVVEFVEVGIQGLPLADVTATLAFLNNSLVNWTLNTFTWTDELSQASTVRYWSPVPLRPQRDTANTYSLTFTLRIE